MEIAALLTCHNRRDKTLACLYSLTTQQGTSHVKMTIILVDDGSSDGTTEAVRDQFPEVKILDGDGTLFWSGGMRVAFSTARLHGFDGYLFVNNDTMLYDDAMRRLMDAYLSKTSPEFDLTIVVGSTLDPIDNTVTYGGFRKGPWWKPLKFTRVRPEEDRAVACDSFNGNCVLIPHSVAERVGNLDEAFTHAMGDIDYGLRAAGLGCVLRVAPGFVGECELNRGKGLWTDPNLPLLTRWQRLIGPKGLPPREWLVFTRRHSGPFWPVYWLNPYLRFWLTGMRNALAGHRKVCQP